MTAFVDTSAWYAAADRDDRSHERATLRLSEFQGRLLTSDHILIETWYLTSSRLGVDIAEDLINSIRTGIARIESTTVADLELAASIREAYPDQDFSIVDRTSWSVMQRLGVHEAIAFDRDYSIYRFGRDRRNAFTVHN
ncbi:MAG: PIN domain-containing protein [Acidimicrobiales bacterium]